jgi:hypothetical protein
VLLAPDDAPRRRKDRAKPLEAGRLHVLLVDEHDHRAARDQRDARREDEREGLPDREKEAASDERGAERGSAQDVLDTLGPAEVVVRHEVGIEAAVGRLVDVVREEEAEEGERRRLEARHEREQRERDRHGHEREHHEGPPPAEGEMRRVAHRPDEKRHEEREDALRREDEPDERGRVGELAEDRREVGGHRRDRPREPERAEAQRPHEPAHRGLERLLDGVRDDLEAGAVRHRSRLR